MRHEPMGSPHWPSPQPPPPWSPNEQLLAAALMVAAATGVLVWATGQLAGLVFGHTWLRLSPGDVAGVVWQLRHHPGDPALAWPAEVRGPLPGPVGMYAAAGVIVGLVIGVAGAVLRRWPGHRSPKAGVAVRPGRATAATWRRGGSCAP